MQSNRLVGLTPPSNVSILDTKRIMEGETNEVYFCRGVVDNRNVDFFLKINKNPKIDLKNEEVVLQELRRYDFPIPTMLFSCHEKGLSFIALEEIQGTILWDLIDPKRKKYDSDQVHIYLYEYGKWLALIHKLPIKWTPQKRPKLYDFIGEEIESDPRFKKSVLWLDANRPKNVEKVFVHGDYNTGSVIFDNKKIKGIIDWEFAGEGWKEYDLAWALRARQNFLSSKKERDFILQGYQSVGTYNSDCLKWCELLNYLHFAYWTKGSDPEYMNFALNRAQNLIDNIE